MRTFQIIIIITAAILFALPAKNITTNGAWCWFTEPRAITSNGTTYTGWVSKEGDIVAASINAATHDVDTAIMHTRLQVDDHANPSFLMWPNGKLFCFYSAHNDSRIRIRTLQTPGSFHSWTSEVGIPMANITDYPCPHMLPSEDSAIYVFFRGGPAWNPYFIKSTDKGSTWSSIRHFISSPGARPYFKFVNNGKDEIHVIFTDGHPRDKFNNVYYACYKNNNLYKANGTLIKSMDALPLLLTEAEKIYDATANNAKAWVWDIALDSAGRPVVAYVNFPSDSDHRYRFIRWDGTQWRDQELTKAGRWFPQTPSGSSESEPNYSGGIQLDHSNPFKLFLSKQDSVTGVFAIEQWISKDYGTSWKKTKVTGGLDSLTVRPVIPHGTGSGMEFMFMRGSYIHYTDYNTSIHMIRTIDTTPPTTPANLEATVGMDGLVTLRWNASTDNETAISEYRIMRGTSRTNMVFTKKVSGSLLTTGDPFTGSADSIYYSVIALNGNGNPSSSSNIVSAVLPPIKSAEIKSPADTIESLVSIQLKVYASYDNGFVDSSNAGVTFTALDPSIARISVGGIATAGDTIGTARFVARRSGTWLFDTCTVIIKRGTIRYLRRFDFRCTADPVKTGWISENGAAYDSAKGYGWTGCATLPASRCDRAGGSLLGTFALILGQNCTTGKFQVALSDGDYLVRIGLGDASYPTEPLEVKHNGTTIATYTNPGNLNNGYSVCDAAITVSGGNGAGFIVNGTPNAKISYMIILSSQGIALSSVADDSLNPGSTTMQKSNISKTETFINPFPNPFNRDVMFDFGIPSDGKCKIDIHSIDGKLIKQLFNGYVKAGKQTIKWSGVDNNGNKVPAGIYFARINSRNITKSVRIMLSN
ncbi:MAG: BNR-4 repeat-containing protein [Fibrobacteres bacterium]|nr:BNR-4 repeat-containing protein [Fibrobacterota bacterium]